MGPVFVHRTSHRLLPDRSRVIAKPFLPGSELGSSTPRAAVILNRVLAMPERVVTDLLAGVLARFAGRHRNFEGILEQNFDRVAHFLSADANPNREQRLLAGAFFTHEYSIEAAALFNPSMVSAPDQSGLEPGAERFVMSLRAVGEGHLSSIEFRTGVIDAHGEIAFEPTSPSATTGIRKPATCHKKHFIEKLIELRADSDVARNVLDPLPEFFSLDELEASIARVDQRLSLPPPPAATALARADRLSLSPATAFQTINSVHALASSNYVTSFPEEMPMSERVLFPSGPYETNGMEDARFVRFVDDDGAVTYYATYTAFDGFEILPQLIETKSFQSFRISTMRGSCAQNKGMALFPRRVGGRYAMLGRSDRESIFFMTSDDIRSWDETSVLKTPSNAWELIQIGNSGPPIETEAGWLVLTHGVGPMRCYALGAILLDLDDPRRVIAELPTPLMLPQDDEREGYVPNVLYTCGGMIHHDQLVLPYGFADFGTKIALISISDLLGALREHSCGG